MTQPTEQLIDGLVERLTPIKPRLMERRLFSAVAGGATIVLLLVSIFLGLRQDMDVAVASTDFWMKLAYTGALAALGLAAGYRLARPEQSTISGGRLAMPIIILALLALFEFFAAPTGQRSALVFGQTWRVCPLLIASLSLPLFAVLMWLFSGFAPKRARLTGAVIGLTAGAITATLYALHCPETAMTFVLLWYSAGIAIVVGVGAIIGPRILRW
jgi:hypothetical protein